MATYNANGPNAPEVAEMIGKAGCWGIAIFTFAVGVFVKVAFERFGWKFFSTLPVLIALIAGYILSSAIGIIDYTTIRNTRIIGFPDFSLPKFSAYAIRLTVPIAIVTTVEHFGDILAIGKVVEKDFLSNPGIHRMLLGDGLATSIGIKNMVDARINLTDPKLLIITAAMLVLGLGGTEFSAGYFVISGLGLSAIVGIVLNAILNNRSFRRSTK